MRNDSCVLYRVMKNFFPAGNICGQLATLQILLSGTSNCNSSPLLNFADNAAAPFVVSAKSSFGHPVDPAVNCVSVIFL